MSPADSRPFETATFEHVAVSVRDLDEMVAFYERAFGFRVEGRASFPSARIRTALLALPSGVRLELAEARDAASLARRSGPAEAALTRGYYHWALEVTDLHVACAVAAAAGANLVVEPSAAAREGMRYAYVEDPDGNLIELVSFP